MSTIADRIKEICAQKGTSMYKLEKQLNLGNGTIGKWGKNGRQPTYDKAVAVANALGVSADYLLTGEQKEKSPSITGGGNMNQYCVQFRLFYCTTGRNPAARSFASTPPPR